jgi:GAF domain-containing protein
VDIPDVADAPAEFVAGGQNFLTSGNRAITIMPMMRGDAAIGALSVVRLTPGPLSDKQIAILRTFAAQAVIAIENTRLLNELRQRTDDLTEALEQQTATSEVLRIVSTEPGKLQPVFDAILTNAIRICDARFGILQLYDGEVFHAQALCNVPPAYAEVLLREPRRALPESGLGRLVTTKQPIHIADCAAEDAYANRNRERVQAVELGGVRTSVVVPLLKGDTVLGGLQINRQEVKPFTEKQIELVASFARQAVIAIENTRLLNELRESLLQQTATSEVLQVISSSPGELEPVFQSMLENAMRICDAKFGIMFEFSDGAYRSISSHGVPQQYDEHCRQKRVWGPDTLLGQVARTKKTALVDDARNDRAYIERDPNRVASVELSGQRTAICVPMLKENELIGAFGIFRQEVRPFTDKQIELVQNFATQAVIAIENARLLSDLRESLERQTATSEVLNVIATSPGKLEPVFQTMLANAIRLCDARFGTLFFYENGLVQIGALAGVSEAVEQDFRNAAGKPPIPGSTVDRMLRTGKPLHVDDLQAEKAMARSPVVRAGGRSYIGVPLLKQGAVVGALGIYRMEVRPFTDSELALVQNFAAQAVIAIENTRLLNELRQRTDDLSESLEQQTATSEVLKVISSSPGELKPVFNSILENAVHICDASFGNLLLYDGDVFRHVALHNAPQAWADEQERDPIPPRHAARVLYRVADTKRVAHVADMAAANPDEPIAIIAGARTVLIVPMLKDNALAGVIAIYRQEVRPFTDKQIDLVRNFAAQAVIAIENTRLLSELRQRTDDLTESLEQQTATSEVLQVISSSPGELEPVFEAMLGNAVGICRARFGNLLLFDGSNMRVVAMHNAPRALEEARRRDPVIPLESSILGPLVRTKKLIHVGDITAEEPYASSPLAKAGGARTALGVPMLRDNELVGAITIYRQEVRPFTDKQIELVTNFAAQAVIAIENTRLLNELRQRTDDLSESLEQQTATSEVLKVISSSPGELEPVFDAMLANATRICEAKFGVLWLYDGKLFRPGAMHGVPPAFVNSVTQRGPFPPPVGTPLYRLLQTKDIVHSADELLEPVQGSAAKYGGARSLVGVPMRKDNELVGAFVIYRQEVRPFSDKQIELVTNFAAQAVIAIENTRLLGELRESLQQQTATADVLKVISRSTFDLQTVLQTLVESAARLCEADKATITRQKGGTFYRAEAYGFSREFMDYIKDIPIEPERGSASGRALLEGRVVHIPDVQADPEYTLVEAQRLGDFRTILCVPMLREGVPIGVLALTRSAVRPFTDKQIELVSTFADQAAIAIENVRLFENVEARTRELAQSLEDLQIAQDRLVQTQKLASLGQLTAGIAHEIKNPLNFVNNFSSISAELLDELQEALQGVQFDDKTRAEIDELTGTLRGNLERIVQHGQRADSIVKNMLLHSREGSGEHRPVDINTVVEESLNLAYHGARAEKQGFNITLERSFDPAAGEVDLFPQEITRVLLNLISNGFYAATKRKAEARDGGYEPMLAAATTNLGDRVEIRIRDNGTGIPPEVKEKMFNPFFTTKPAGEGTGLGLSLSYDIIVKQHAGSIEVDTQPGEFTEFRIVLPRGAATIAKSGERA